MTTIITVRKGGKVIMAGDGQVSLGATIIKSNARKVRRLGGGNVIGGFAGATAMTFLLSAGLETLASTLLCSALMALETGDIIGVRADGKWLQVVAIEPLPTVPSEQP